MNGLKDLRGRCHYCNRNVYPVGHIRLTDGSARSDQACTRDHVVPRALTGRGVDGTGNIVRACERCNMAKSDSPYESFKLFADNCLRGASYKGDAGQVRAMYLCFVAGQILS